VRKLNRLSRLEVLMAALAEKFGTAAVLFLWLKLPDGIDSQTLAEVAMAEGAAINGGSRVVDRHGTTP
jgi:DNA-binding transcriptional MocR family regulator